MPTFQVIWGKQTASFDDDQCGQPEGCSGCRQAFELFLKKIKEHPRQRWSKKAFAATPEAWRRELIGAFAVRGMKGDVSLGYARKARK